MFATELTVAIKYKEPSALLSIQAKCHQPGDQSPLTVAVLPSGKDESVRKWGTSPIQIPCPYATGKPGWERAAAFCITLGTVLVFIARASIAEGSC